MVPPPVMFVGLQLFVGHISDEKPRTSHTDRLHIRYQGVWQLVNFYTHKNDQPLWILMVIE